MREVTFLKRNADYWKAFELQLKDKQSPDPDELAEKFIRLTDDLSYARTYYSKSNTTRYLNELTTIVHQKIYKNKREKKNRFITFIRYEVPLASYQLRKQFLFAFIIFFVSTMLGIISLQQDESFARYILGDGYVNMTIENIRHGDPMGVYKEARPIVMFFEIALNNIMVALRMFVQGIGLAMWGAYALFQNGVMLGVFQFFFYKYHLMYQSALTIWIHGTLEISAFTLAGGAGMGMGNSLLFPGTYTRMQSLKFAARNGIKVMMSLLPVFLTAAFFESYVTRHTEMPHWLSIGIIVCSLSFILYYYVIYPMRLYAANTTTGTEAP